MARKYGSRPVSKATDVFLSIPPKCQDPKHSPHSGNNVFSNHQNMSYLSASTVKLPPPNPRCTHGGLSDWSWLGHMMLHIWDRLSLRSNVWALPLEAKSQSGMHGAQAHVGLDVWFQVVPAPPTHTITVHIFFWWTHKYTHLFPFLPSSRPSNVILLPGNTSSLEGKKTLHCFPAIHSSYLKVPASKGKKQHCWFLGAVIFV